MTGFFSKIAICSCIFLFVAVSSYSDTTDCLKYRTMYIEFHKQKQYQRAYLAWQSAFSFCPHTVELLTDGTSKILPALIHAASDSIRYNKLTDSIFLIYDLIIKKPGQAAAASAWANKGIDILRYRKPDKEEWLKANHCFENSFALDKNQSWPVKTAYLNTMVKLNECGIKQPADILNCYLKIAGNGNPITSSGETTIEIDHIFSKAHISCDTINAYFLSLLSRKKNDSYSASVAIRALRTGGCDTFPAFLIAAEILHASNPMASSALNLAEINMQKARYKSAVSRLKEAVLLSNDSTFQLNCQLQIARLLSEKIPDHEAAREAVLQAIALNPLSGESYMVLAAVYASTVNCTDDELQKRSVYWLATDAYQRAAEIDPGLKAVTEKKIGELILNYPDKHTVAIYGYREGQEYTVGCWINRKTTVREKK